MLAVPNLKPLRLFYQPSHEYVRGFLSKRTTFKVDLLLDHQTYCVQTCMSTLFSPKIAQAGAVKGLMCSDVGLTY